MFFEDSSFWWGSIGTINSRGRFIVSYWTKRSWMDIFWLLFAFAALATLVGGVYATYVKLCNLQNSLNLNIRTLDTDCTDGNVCTLDYQVADGCENIRLPDGTTCTGSVCYESGTTACENGDCVGTCGGFCFNVTTCQGLFNDSFVTGEESFTTACGDVSTTASQDVCFWNALNFLFPSYLGVSCSGSVANSPIYNQFCIDKVLSTLPIKECLHATATCHATNSSLISCNYVHGCALELTNSQNSNGILNFLFL